MSTLHTILTVLEIVLVVGTIIAVFYEPAIAMWEEKQKEKFLKAFNNRRKYRR